MGQHKIPGASKGPDYKTEQRNGIHRVALHYTGPGTGGRFKTSNGVQYVRDEQGTVHRLDKYRDSQR